METSHVVPRVAEKLGESAEVRIDCIREGFWAGLPEANKVVQLGVDLASRTRVGRPDCASIEGETNMGKSTIIARLRKLHKLEKLTEHGIERTIQRFVGIQCPAQPNIRKLLEGLLSELVDPRLARLYAGSQATALKLLVSCDVRTIAIDNCQKMVNAGNQTQQAVRGIINEMSESGISFMFFGSNAMRHWIAADKHLSSRVLYRSLLRPLQIGTLHRSFLASIEKNLALRYPSGIATSLERLIHPMTEGFVGETVKLLRLAAETAVDREERITEAVLHRVQWSSPSRRTPTLLATGDRAAEKQERERVTGVDTTSLRSSARSRA